MLNMYCKRKRQCDRIHTVAHLLDSKNILLEGYDPDRIKIWPRWDQNSVGM
jgi:hypothetical protein